MNAIGRLILAGVLGLLLMAPSAARAAEPAPDVEKGFVPLFDGRTFDGWEGDKTVFRIEDGAIVGGSLKKPLGRNHFLCTTKEYGDFELRLKFRITGRDVNGGVQFRSQRVPNDTEVSGYQADMGQNYWGGLYDESRRNRTLVAPNLDELKKVLHMDGWNDYRILCRGAHIQLWVNGMKTVDYTEPDAKIARSGIIGLQIHAGPPAETMYKDIRIRTIPAGGE